MYISNRNFKNILFKTLFIPITLLILFLLIIIAIMTDRFLLFHATSKAIQSANNSCTSLEKSILTDIVALDNIAANPNVKSTFRSVSNDNYTEELDNIYKTSEILNVYKFTQPGVTNIRMFSPNITSNSIRSDILLPLSLLTSSKRFSAYTNLHSAIILEGAPYKSIVDPTDTLSCDTSSIALLTQTKDNDGTVLGYICTTLSKSYLYTNCLNTVNNCEMMVTSGSGSVILSTNLYNNNTTLNDALSTSKPGYYSQNINGVKSYIIFSQANAYGWKVVLSIPVASICLWQKYIVLFLVLALIASVLMAYSYSVHFSRKITYPIHMLIEAINASSKCDQEQDITEFSELVTMYNSLLDHQSLLISNLKQQITKTKNAEIKSLLAQINPHFLYNTLNAIGWRALDGDAQSVCQLISKLSKLCKINYNFNDVTTIDMELSQINLYLDLQLECIEKSFSFTINAPENSIEYLIPSFILQPLVENSIIHGFSQINRQGTIKIDIHIADLITITITDNGSGISEKTLQNLNKNNYHSEKYGVYNINNRIKTMCGEDFGITFNSGSSWTTAKIILPIIPASGNVK